MVADEVSHREFMALNFPRSSTLTGYEREQLVAGALTGRSGTPLKGVSN